jgi:hypothetical protein
MARSGVAAFAALQRLRVLLNEDNPAGPPFWSLFAGREGLARLEQRAQADTRLLPLCSHPSAELRMWRKSNVGGAAVPQSLARGLAGECFTDPWTIEVQSVPSFADQEASTAGLYGFECSIVVRQVCQGCTKRGFRGSVRGRAGEVHITGAGEVRPMTHAGGLHVRRLSDHLVLEFLR